MTDSSPQSNPNAVPGAADVPAAAEGQQQEQRRGGGAAAAVAVTDVVIAGADVAAKIATQNGKSASFKSDGSPKPSKVAKR